MFVFHTELWDGSVARRRFIKVGSVPFAATSYGAACSRSLNLMKQSFEGKWGQKQKDDRKYKNVNRACVQQLFKRSSPQVSLEWMPVPGGGIFLLGIPVNLNTLCEYTRIFVAYFTIYIVAQDVRNHTVWAGRFGLLQCWLGNQLKCLLRVGERAKLMQILWSTIYTFGN